MLRLRLSTIARITIGLAGLLGSTLCLVVMLGLFPNRLEDVMRSRAEICETAAVGFSLLAEQNDTGVMRQYMESIVNRQSEITSMGVRQNDGTLLINVSNHDAHWGSSRHSRSNQTHVSVQLFANGKLWGTVETCFAPLVEGRMTGGLVAPAVIHGVVVTILCMVIFYSYLRAVLQHLNPSKVVPKRVREALDTLAEGLLVLDQEEHIVLANRAFGETTGMNIDSLIGVSISRLPLVRSTEETMPIPWTEAIRTGKPVKGQMFGMSRDEKEDVTFSVSVSPIINDEGKGRGVLASFENVTQLERKKRDLTVMVDHLRMSSKVLKDQNRELERLATRDTLTNLLIRRPFFERLDAEWKSAVRYGHALSAVMVDVDFFKSINDNWGHATGDDVLRQVAAAMQKTARLPDIVCRYGGEEFAVIMPHTNLADAALAAERLRLAVEELDLGDIAVTVSLGVSSLSGKPKDPSDLLSQADQCLYAAKRAGRNQVICWGDIPKDFVDDESPKERMKECEDMQPTSIPYHAVAALISALAYRDHTTAGHSRRVADVCVATAEGLLSFSDCYVLEIAALLHDIGKIGVPDRVLLKPGPLTPDEWKVMRRNDAIGVEIVRAAFASPKLNEVIGTYQAHYGNPNARPGLPTGNSIPVSARILAIADAYDSMVTNRVYRNGCSSEEAFAELKRCAGVQFDPELVERFITIVSQRRFKTDAPTTGISRENALAIGLQIERLLAALDSQDYVALEAICGRVRSTAQKCGAVDIATTASNVCAILELDDETDGLFKVVYELLDLCRSAQAAFLEEIGRASSTSDADTSWTTPLVIVNGCEK